MKIGDCVFQLYGGMHRYGSVKEINRDMNGDGWTWLKIDWIDDEEYERAMKWKAELRNKKPDEFILEYYRCDDVHRINVDRTLNILKQF